MFHTLISSLTDAEIAADISTCRAVLKAGEVNGYPLDSDCEAVYRDRLADLLEEREIRCDNLAVATLTSIDPEDFGTVPVRRAA